MHFVCVFGPPAVGKMTVGRELARLTGYKLLHNHMTVEPVLDIFPFGSPPFGRLVNEFRRRILEEAVAADLPGLVFTLVWGLEDERDRAWSRRTSTWWRPRGRVTFVELYAPLEERLARNRTELRLAEALQARPGVLPRNVLDLEEYVMNTGGTPTLAESYWRPRLRADRQHRPVRRRGGPAGGRPLEFPWAEDRRASIARSVQLTCCDGLRAAPMSHQVNVADRPAWSAVRAGCGGGASSPCRRGRARRGSPGARRPPPWTAGGRRATTGRSCRPCRRASGRTSGRPWRRSRGT